MTLNAVIALILLFFIKFDKFSGRLIDYITLVEDRPIMSVNIVSQFQSHTFGENYNVPAVSLR